MAVPFQFSRPPFNMLETTEFTLPGVNGQTKLTCSFVRWRPLQGVKGSTALDLDPVRPKAPLLQLSLVFFHCNGTREYTPLCVFDIQAS